MSALIHPLVGLANRLRGLFTGRNAADLRSTFSDDGDDWICFNEADLKPDPNPAVARSIALPTTKPTRVSIAA